MKIQYLLASALVSALALRAPPLSVAITQTPTNLSAFYLDVLNMTPGLTYGIGGKVMPDSDPFNSWTLLDIFDAPAPAVRYEVAALQSQRTYLAVNLNNYVGPSVRILSPSPGSVVSGDVRVQVLVTDILPLFTVEVFVGATLAGAILPGQGGVMNLPTHWFPNGEREIWVRVVNEGIDVDTDGDQVADNQATFASWGSVTVTFANDVYMENFSELYSAYGLSYFAATPHDYTFEVFRLDGELLHTQSGAIDGSLSPQWNFTDLLGSPVNDSGYVFSLTATPTGGGMAASSSPASSAYPSLSGETETEQITQTAQAQKFQSFSSGELVLVERGTSLSEITRPEPKLTDEDVVGILAKVAALEPTGPPPLPTSPPWPPKLLPGYPTMSVSASSGPASPGATVIITTNFFDKGVTVGEYVVSYGEWPSQVINDRNDDMNGAMSYFVNVAALFDPDIVGENRTTHPSSAIHPDFTADGYQIRRATETNDFAVLTNALANQLTGSWYWSGHSSATAIIRGSEHPPYLSIIFSAHHLADLLGNRFSGPYTNLVYNRRYFSTINAGCNAFNGSWPIAVGTPHGVDQWDNPLLRKSVFVAFASASYQSASLTGWSARLHEEWIDGFNYDTPLWIALNRANEAYPVVATWEPGIRGFESLVYNGEDSR